MERGEAPRHYFLKLVILEYHITNLMSLFSLCSQLGTFCRTYSISKLQLSGVLHFMGEPSTLSVVKGKNPLMLNLVTLLGIQ